MSQRIVVLLCAFGFSACGTVAPTGQEVPPFRVLARLSFDPDSQPTSGVLRSESEEAAYLAAHPRQVYYINGEERVAPFPEVDYGTETALVVALSGRPSSVEIRIDSVVTHGDHATAYTTVVVPCVNYRDVTSSALIATIDGANRVVTFAPRSTERLPCQ